MPATATTYAPLTRRATAVYRSASPAHIEAGRRWYSDAWEVARDQAQQHEVPFETACGILAAFSPRTAWGKNVMFAERMLSQGGTMQGGTLGRSIEQARRIYQGEHALDVLGGRKTRAFFSAIYTGGTSKVAVIDRHAWDMLTDQRGAKPPTDKQYDEAAIMMARAARILGVNVHHLQATTWLVWRARFWAPGTFDHNPQPMLEGSESW